MHRLSSCSACPDDTPRLCSSLFAQRQYSDSVVVVVEERMKNFIKTPLAAWILFVFVFFVFCFFGAGFAFALRSADDGGGGGGGAAGFWYFGLLSDFFLGRKWILSAFSLWALLLLGRRFELLESSGRSLT